MPLPLYYGSLVPGQTGPRLGESLLALAVHKI